MFASVPAPPRICGLCGCLALAMETNFLAYRFEFEEVLSCQGDRFLSDELDGHRELIVGSDFQVRTTPHFDSCFRPSVQRIKIRLQTEGK